MKKSVISIICFVAAFILTYLALCYCVPGFRIKLDADPLTYFVESIAHMALFKGLTSLVIGAVIATVPLIIKRK